MKYFREKQTKQEEIAIETRQQLLNEEFSDGISVFPIRLEKTEDDFQQNLFHYTQRPRTKKPCPFPLALSFDYLEIDIIDVYLFSNYCRNHSSRFFFLIYF